LILYISKFISPKKKKNRNWHSCFFLTLKIWKKKIIDDWSPDLSFVPKIWVCIFLIFYTQRPFQNGMALVYTYFGSKEMWILMFFFSQKRGHLEKNILRKLRKMFSVDHKNWFYIYQNSFLPKRNNNRNWHSYFFSTLKIWKKKHRWLVTLIEFCPKNSSLYFFHFWHSKTFPKWYDTCIYVYWIERNVFF
jgi:hypothetical protein